LREFWNTHSYGSPDGLPWSHAIYLELLRPTIRGKHVLELGCGRGTLSGLLAESAASVTAVDFSEAMLSAAKAKYAHIDNLHFVASDILELDLADRFEVVCGIAVLHEIGTQDYPRLIATLKRHMAAESQGCFQENSFFNPLFRLFRTHFVGRFGIPKFGSIYEKPFDAERFQLLKRGFRYCRRSGEVFLLFQKVHDYAIRSRRFGPVFDALDQRVSAWPLPDVLKRNLSYIQHIYFSDSKAYLANQADQS
jgi:ubiquinone/menaquinone biosynthesis C-methylase UbiE